MNARNAAHQAADCDAQASPWAELTVRYAGLTIEYRHLRVPTQQRKRRATLEIAAGGLLLATSLALFAYDLSLDWEGYQAAVVAAQTESRPVPSSPSFGATALAAALGLLGLVPLVLGSMRRRERDLTAFKIGESPESELVLPGQGLPDPASMTLVEACADRDGTFTLQLTDSMFAGLQVKGIGSASEDSLAGVARSETGTWQVPLAGGCLYQFQLGDVEFALRVVDRGALPPSSVEVDKPLLAHVAGVGVFALMGALTLASWPPDYGDFDYEETIDPRFFISTHRPDEVEQVEPEPNSNKSGEIAGGSRGQRASGSEGKMGDRRSKSTRGHYQLRKYARISPRVGRNFDPEAAARKAGVLGLMGELHASILASPDGGAFSVGHADEDVWGQLSGPKVGAAYGVGGLGLVGTGQGGGGTGAGTIGIGNTGLIGTVGPNKTGGGSFGPGAGSGFNRRVGRRPTIRPESPQAKGMDRSIIRRIVRAHINEVRACYNQGLNRNPNLRGRVTVNFTIGATGKVGNSLVGATSLRDQKVGRCIARAVSRWRFPRPDAGGVAVVTYPFLLNPA